MHLGHRWLAEADSAWQAVVSLQVVCPGELEILATTHDGGIKIRGASRCCSVSSSGSAIDVQAAVARTRIRTINGSLRVDLSHGDVGEDFDCDIQTFNGSISLTLDPQVSAKLGCKSRNGQMDCGLELVDAAIDRRSIGGRLGAGSGSIKIHSFNGGIQLRPRGAGR